MLREVGAALRDLVLVAGYLRSLSAADDEFRRLLERQQDQVLARLGSFSAADRLERSEVHDRAVR